MYSKTNAPLSTSGSFTLSLGVSNTGGNDEDIEEQQGKEEKVEVGPRSAAFFSR